MRRAERDRGVVLGDPPCARAAIRRDPPLGLEVEYETKAGLRWRFVYRRSNGSLTSRRGFTRRRAALDARRAMVESVRRGEIVAARETFADFYAAFLEAKRPYVSAGTWVDYEIQGRKRLIPILGALKLSDVDEDRVREWMARMAEAVAAGDLGTRVRISEALGLRWTDLDFEAGVVRIARQRSRANDGTAPTKGQRFRSVQIGPLLAERMRGVKASRHEDDGGWVFLCPPPARGQYSGRAASRSRRVARPRGTGTWPRCRTPVCARCPCTRCATPPRRRGSRRATR